jgi:hypothetical protein
MFPPKLLVAAQGRIGGVSSTCQRKVWQPSPRPRSPPGRSGEDRDRARERRDAGRRSAAPMLATSERDAIGVGMRRENLLPACGGGLGWGVAPVYPDLAEDLHSANLAQPPHFPPPQAIGFTHPSSISAGSAVPDPCSASMSGPLRGLLASLAIIDPCARLRLLVSMVFAGRSRPGRPASRSKDHGCPSPHRSGAVTAKRAKRSGAAAKRLDGDGPMWPAAVERCVNAVAPTRGVGVRGALSQPGHDAGGASQRIASAASTPKLYV